MPIVLQIADSAFPTGAFAYSNGLEALARAGSFPDVATLEDYLKAYLQQAVSFDLPFVDAAHASDDANAFTDLCLEWDAYFWNQAVRKASLRQGRALLDLLREVFPNPELEFLKTHVEDREYPLHFAPTLGRGLAMLGASRNETQSLYLHSLLRDQMAAVLRLGLLGPHSTQSMQSKILASVKLPQENVTSAQPEKLEAWRAAPLVDVGQGGHNFLYSRLFQN